MCSQTVPQAAVLSAAAALDVTASSEQRPAGQLKPRQRAVPVPRATIRSLSALALMDSLAASPYSSWADSYRGGNGHQFATTHCTALRPAVASFVAAAGHTAEAGPNPFALARSTDLPDSGMVRTPPKPAGARRSSV
jgi:hypothetical protein